jgi:hypothetical protein
MEHAAEFEPLLAYLRRIPAIRPRFGSGRTDDGMWWVKFAIDLDHPGAWKAVMDLGYVLNWLSLAQPLPTVFRPVSPPPDMNGNDPRELLAWVIECRTPQFTPKECAETLDVSLFDYE